MIAGRQPLRDRVSKDGRAGFTLAELLVVIAIIGILTSMTLFALYGVREDAKESRTRAEIAKINEVIMQHWESYRTRPMPIRIAARTDPYVAAAIRLNALRELMRMELPDRTTDLFLRNAGTGAWFPPTSVPNPSLFYASTPVGLQAPPSRWLAYQRRIAANASRGNNWTNLHEHAECLYMILAATHEGDTAALDFFSEKEIGDTDGDGMPEILDAWGKPIYFLRWAPGYVSELQDPRRREPDPFDPLRVDPRWENNDDTDPNTKLDDPFALFPLIYSAGRDKKYGVVRKDYDPTINPPPDFDINYFDTHLAPYNSAALNPALYSYAPVFPPPPWPSVDWPAVWPSRPMNDPYVILPRAGDYVGRRFVNGNADDDLTNHLLEVR